MLQAHLNSSFLNYLDSVYWSCSVMANPIQPVLHPITTRGAKCSLSPKGGPGHGHGEAKVGLEQATVDIYWRPITCNPYELILPRFPRFPLINRNPRI